MKIQTILTILVLTIGFNHAFAANNYKSETASGFKSTDGEVTMSIERGKGEVLLHIVLNDLKQYDHIIIERSAESPNYFGKCKYVSCAESHMKDGNLLEVDKYPFPASKDVYYRIKTVTKDGIERAYPAIVLAALK